MIEFRVLGPLEAFVGEQPVSLGGPKQLTVLALLLLRAHEVVSVQRLIDEVWGDLPPQSAPQSLETYVSRLRRALAPYGPTIVRRGPGYSLDLGNAVLDAQRFAELAGEASRASAENDHERAATVALEALALWHGRALADVNLGPGGRAEAQRLEELRLRTLEQRFDAELASGRDEELAGELQVLVSQNPYRERFVVQLMLALYRSGRQADALAVYEQTRTVLAADLGLQPSEELQQLSGRIVRQEPELGGPSFAAPVRQPRPISTTPRAVALTAAVIALALALTASGSAPHPATAAATPNSKRVALVLPRAPDAGDAVTTGYRDALAHDAALMSPKLATRMIVLDETDPTPRALVAAADQLRNGGFGLVMWIGEGEAARALAPLVRTMPRTKFVYVDASLDSLSLNGVRNASAVRFAEEETSELVGYLSGLVAPRGHPGHERADVVSVVAGNRTRQIERNVAGFKRGVLAASPGTRVLVGYTRETEDRTLCEQLANTQIDKGSDVVFTVAGRCGSGALAVAKTRGVWGAGKAETARESTSYRMLVSTYKEYEWGIDIPVDRFLSGTLPAGQDLVLGLDDDYAVGVLDTSLYVPPAAVSKMVDRCSAIRQRTDRETE